MKSRFCEEEIVAYIKLMYATIGEKTIPCKDEVITYYRAYDEAYTWHIHNALSFICCYNSQVSSGIAHNGQTKINRYLKAILRTINHIVFDGVKESKYQAHMSQHLKTFLYIAYMSDSYGICAEAIDFIAKRCVQLYSPKDPSVINPRNPLNLLDVEDIKDSFDMEIYNISIKNPVYADATVVETKVTNSNTKDSITIKLVFHF
jgi:hypothetical protein